MVKVESILKWKVEGSLLKKIKLIRAQILSKNEDAVAIPDGDLHVTLASGEGWKSLRSKWQKLGVEADDPDFSIDIEPNPKVMEKGGRKSWYVRMKHQRDWKEYVMDLLQGGYDKGRIYHISLANLSGKIGDSVALVEERDYKDEYKKFQSSRKSKKYRAELNRYNRKRGTYGNGDKKDASHRNGRIVGFEDESVNRGRAEKSRLRVAEDFFYLDEDITPEQLSNTKKALNKQFSPLGMSVDLQTRHFSKRVDDTRNVKPISSAELIGVFKRAAKKWKSKKFTDTILNTVDPVTGNKDQQAVIYDPRTDINIAAVLNTTRSKTPEFVIKTIMRKKDFKTRSPKLEI